MRRVLRTLCLITSGLALSISLSAFAKEPAASKPLSTAQVKKALIQASIDEYPGRCPCPYNTMRNGHACGGRSAYSKPGGSSPLCYETDVTSAMVEQWRKTHEPQQKPTEPELSPPVATTPASEPIADTR